MASVSLAKGLSQSAVKRDKHPEWFPPSASAKVTAGDKNALHVLNSLTDNVEPFTPINGRQIKWYTCGPTVYDMSHMGHARAYLTFDIIRRILEDYFGYSILFQMNITDIDDKIIKRARINKLLEDYQQELQHDAFKLSLYVQQALEAAERKLSKKKAELTAPLGDDASPRARSEREEKYKEWELKMSQFLETKAKIEKELAAKHFDSLFRTAADVVGDLLDEQKGQHVKDQAIFDTHARKYERAFFEDMGRLGIREPDVVTRVTEYVPEVIAFVEKIIQNGFAYRAESSIFFDTEAYLKAGHKYPKLKAGGEKNTTAEEMAEGEGALSKGVEGEKRSANDFALWKFSKPGEPEWDSPWGKGRPGWHIECSVMASDILGSNMDIHSGGCDLKFPHHDNECAQSEAYNGEHQWVNYFLHCGHLNIKGLKMSKSLKNFITIRQALDDLKVTPREMRLLFLSNNWAKTMNFSDQSIEESRERERVLRAFFGSIEIVLRGDAWSLAQGFNEKDRALKDQLLETEQAIHEALCNNFDTPVAMERLMALVASTNKYLLLKEERLSATLLRKIGLFATKILRVFGVVTGNDAIGFSAQGSASDAASEARFNTVVDTLVRFRDEVRTQAKETKQIPVFLPLCDQVRDEWLVDAGVRLEDVPGGATAWKNDEPDVLRREREDRLQQARVDQQNKLVNQIETKRKLVEKWLQFEAGPALYFSSNPENATKFSHYDPDSGLPTIDAAGVAVSEKVLKNLKKDQAKYVKSHAEYLGKGGKAWLQEQQAELAAMRTQLESMK